MLHTMERILGLPPMNQQDAMAPLMFDCFTSVPNFTPYTALPNNVPLAQGTIADLFALAIDTKFGAQLFPPTPREIVRFAQAIQRHAPRGR